MREFGGDWTVDKLDMVEDYLDAYTTALKDKPFKLMYIDAFAGRGVLSSRDKDEEARRFVEGSALRAANVHDRPFDELLLVEKDSTHYRELQDRMRARADDRIRIYNQDANQFCGILTATGISIGVCCFLTHSLPKSHGLHSRRWQASMPSTPGFFFQSVPYVASWNENRCQVGDRHVSSLTSTETTLGRTSIGQYSKSCGGTRGT